MKRTTCIIAIVLGLFLAVQPAVEAGFWSDVKSSAKKAWKDIKEAGKQAPGAVAEDAKKAWSDVKETGGNSGKAVTREIKKTPDDIKKGVKEATESN